MSAKPEAQERRAARAAMRTEIGSDDLKAFRFLQRGMLRVALIASVLAAVYWGLIAADRYVSEAHVVVQRTDIGSDSGNTVATLLSGGTSQATSDQLLLRDHLTSVDMLQKLDAKLNLREHYSKWRWDPISRLLFKDTSIEQFHDYYMNRVEVEQNDYSGVLVIKAQGFDAKTAQAITSMLADEGERYMNELSHKLARDQVAFLEKQVADISVRVSNTRTALIDFQNKEGLVSPASTADALTAVTNNLEAQIASLKAKRSDLLSYLSKEAPDIVRLNSQISALELQLAAEQRRLASGSDKSLNRVVEGYQRLEMEAKLALDLYQTALVALEKGRIDATRNIKKLSVLQAPTLPQYAIEPRRMYNIVVFVLCAMVLTGIAHLVIAVIKDHKD
jgi:capsular polysaccharide transport system permease protein